MVSATSLTADQWMGLKPQIDPTSITVSIASPPVVTFKVTDDKGNPVVGLGGQSKSASNGFSTNYNIAFTLAKLVSGTNGDPSKWVSYLVTRPATVAENTATPATAACDAATGAKWCGTYPTSDNQGTLVDNGDGTYKYTFLRDVTQAAAIVASLPENAANNRFKADLGDVSYDAKLTHRLGIIISGSQPGTGTATPTAVATTPPVPMLNTFNIGFDFVPAGGTPTATRDIVAKASCASCHDNRAIGHISTPSATNGIPTGAFVGRNDPRLCVTCHTDQTKYSFAEVTKTATGYSGNYARVNGEAAFTFPRMIHQFHMGEELTKTGYNLNKHCNDPREPLTYDKTKAVANSAACFNTVGLPQSPANCTKCHDASNNATTGTTKTTNGDNWKNVPSMMACGACHDGINFADGTGTTLNGQYSGHLGGAQTDNAQCAICHKPASMPIYHATTVASPNNPTVQAGVASFVYKIPAKGVTINASKQVVVQFQILKDGTPVKLNTYAPGGLVMIDGFTGGPSLKAIYATGQDGIAAPSDWNSGHDGLNLFDSWAGVNGNTLVLSDAATNTYTATLVASSAGRSASHSLTLPDDAKMVTAVLSDSFTQTGVGAVPGVPAMIAATGNTPDGKPNVARRVIFSEDKCNSCHDRLGTSPNFHGGNYSIAMCAICHTPNQGGSTGWSASFRTWAHGIHGASKRTIPYTWHAVSATDNYSQIGYPGVLKDCAQCHLPGTYDFSASQYTDALVGNMLNVQAATGVKVLASSYVPPQAAPVGSAATSGLLAYGLVSAKDYGTGWSIDPATGKLVTVSTQANNLVTSPITAVCSSCHDSASAISHFRTNAGSFYDLRSVAVTKTETCLVCHGPGNVAAIADVHK